MLVALSPGVAVTGVARYNVLDLVAILPSSPIVLAMDVLVELGKGSSRKQVKAMVMAMMMVCPDSNLNVISGVD